METEFIYWRHHTLPGIKVEEVCGGDCYSLPIWTEMAYQVYSENGRDGYREIGHFRNGAPFLMGENGRISITHTDHFLAVATLPPTPEVDLSVFSERAAVGIDALYKAAMQEGLDWREDITIIALPKIGPAVPVYDKKEFDPIQTGEAIVKIEDTEYRFVLYSYESEGNIVTLAYSPRCAKFGA